jgi:hypothetical protein
MDTEDNVIPVDGKDVVVRADTAKAYRFVHWGVITAAIALAILAVTFITLYWLAPSSGKVESPAETVNANSR